jgi:3-oxoadipate enol-lactonase
MSIEKIRVGDIHIAFRWDGDPDGPVVVMAHAMGTSHRIWDLQIAALSDHYHILRYDWRGHGDSGAPEGPYSLEQFLRDAVGMMDALDLEKVHWVGISTGGMIGLGLAIHYPERIQTLTLCNTTSQSDSGYRNWVAKRREIVLESGMEPVWEMTKHLWFSDSFVEEESAAFHDIREVFVRMSIPGYLGGSAAVAGLAYRDRLHEITAPTRIIAAGDDPVAPIERSEEIRDRINGSTLTVIDGQRHFSNVEVPERFNKILRDGLEEMST